MNVAGTPTRGYALHRYQEALHQAEGFVEAAAKAARAGKAYTSTDEDRALAKALTRRRLVHPGKLKECVEYLKEAGWLPDVPSFAEVVAQRGLLPRTQIKAVLTECRQNALRANRAYGACAARLGFVEEETAEEILWEMGTEVCSLALPTVLMDRGIIQKEQHKRIMESLRGSGGADASTGAAPP